MTFRSEGLPYRPGVGMMIINSSKKVFVAKRTDTKIQAWQMPQGGIDVGETPSKAALREMREEIGTDRATILAESNSWYCYDIPNFLIKKLWDGNYRGQRQKWFLIRFEGNDSEINLGTKSPEFSEWRWVDLQELPEIIIPFKKRLYESVIKEFSPIISK
jgi:putative (di)nucleoside polyphosphate hydrolase